MVLIPPSLTLILRETNEARIHMQHDNSLEANVRVVLGFRAEALAGLEALCRDAHLYAKVRTRSGGKGGNLNCHVAETRGQGYK